MKILGIDYGSKRIGLAIGSEKEKIAFPYKEIENEGKEFVLKKLKEIINEEGIKKIVVGLPLGLKKQKTEKTKEVLDFINYLKKKIKLPIIKEDERLTTKYAEKLSKEKKDSVEAMIILQSYLDRR